MKKLLLLTLLLIGNYSFSQENLEEISREREKLEDLARSAYFEKGGKLLFYDIFNQSDRWGFKENMTADELRDYIKDLEQVKAKWEAPNGPLQLALSRVDNFHAYNNKNCSTYGVVGVIDYCKIRDHYKKKYPRKSLAYENAIGQWQRKYDFANQLLAKKSNNPNSITSNQSNNNSTSSTNNSSSQQTGNNNTSNSSNRETSEQRLKRLDRERGEQIMQETENNVARIKANSEQLGNSLNNIISSAFRKDRTNEAIIKNKYDENKKIIANYDKEYDAYERVQEEEKLSEITFFNDFIKNPENEKLIFDIQKSFEQGFCSNNECENGIIKDTKLQLCNSRLDGCNGKGYVEVGAFIPGGQTAHPNDGKEIHKRCNASGIIKKIKEKNCAVCNGDHKNSLNYVGNQNYTQNFIIEFKKTYREQILTFIKIKDYFKNNPNEKYARMNNIIVNRSLNEIFLSNEEESKIFYSNVKDGINLLSSEKNGLYGFVDNNNNLVIDHQYALASNMINGFAVVENLKGKIGAINELNEEVIKIKYDAFLPLNSNFNTFITKTEQGFQFEIANGKGELEKVTYNKYENFTNESSHLLTTVDGNITIFTPNNKIERILEIKNEKFLNFLFKVENGYRLYSSAGDYISKIYKEIKEFKQLSGDNLNVIYKTIDADGYIGYIFMKISFTEDRISKKSQMYSDKIDEITPQYLSFIYADDYKLIVENENHKFGVVDVNTNEVIIPISFSKISLKKDSFNKLFFFCQEFKETNSRKGLKYDLKGKFIKNIKI